VQKFSELFYYENGFAIFMYLYACGDRNHLVFVNRIDPHGSFLRVHLGWERSDIFSETHLPVPAPDKKPSADTGLSR